MPVILRDRKGSTERVKRHDISFRSASLGSKIEYRTAIDRVAVEVERERAENLCAPNRVSFGCGVSRVAFEALNHGVGGF